MELKKVVLNDLHIKSGAKMVPFAGYYMPVQYTSVLEEHHTVRNAVGVFDISHMGEFFIRGPKALDLIQKITSNDASVLSIGQAQYSYFPNPEGGIIDDLVVYRLSESEYMLVVNASNIEKDWAWVKHHNTEKAELENASDKISLFAIQGPKASDCLQSLTNINLSDIKYYTFVKGEFADVPGVVISATGYTGAGGFELYFPNEYAETLWHKIMEAGAPYGIRPIGLAARDTLRLEMGFCLYGNDINDHTSPLEAGLGWITKFTKKFVGEESLRTQKEKGLEKAMVGLKMIEKGIPRGGYEIYNEKGDKIGNVTSGTQSPTLGIGIAMGYVKKPFSKAGTAVFIAIRDKKLKAEITKLPFLSKD